MNWYLFSSFPEQFISCFYHTRVTICAFSLSYQFHLCIRLISVLILQFQFVFFIVLWTFLVSQAYQQLESTLIAINTVYLQATSSCESPCSSKNQELIFHTLTYFQKHGLICRKAPKLHIYWRVHLNNFLNRERLAKIDISKIVYHFLSSVLDTFGPDSQFDFSDLCYFHGGHEPRPQMTPILEWPYARQLVNQGRKIWQNCCR